MVLYSKLICRLLKNILSNSCVQLPMILELSMILQERRSKCGSGKNSKGWRKIRTVRTLPLFSLHAEQSFWTTTD
ncbi:uncharacterized protein [Blastocystis hominis]|uniref:Uncharacterized protein n=1 Tax=Blastocystis hominis TaxID=12968 RepID=D8M9K4_BLAHO|nr:uncharacterized protein [Blastocystis hominis]CBK24743.2 unnamed protein product [Blastocystis hominis]|eukprot:XP_012898791.1 uncharacterized protein [Blastocystis hominis]